MDWQKPVRRLISAGLVVAALLAALLMWGAVPAGAQQAPPPDTSSCDTGAYPPPTPHIEPNLRLSLPDGLLQPGTSTGRLTLLGGQPGGVYSGTLFSTEISVAARTADADGTVHFDGLVIPTAFQLGAIHVLYVYRDGCLAGMFNPCVDATGHLATTCPSSGVAASKNGGVLPRTGIARLEALLRAAGLAFALGTLLLYLRRRRLAAAPHH